MVLLDGDLDDPISVPVGTPLPTAPIETVLAVPEEKPAGWVEGSVPITELETGDLTRVERIHLHVSGRLSEYPLPVVETTTGSQQGQLAFSLDGWSLRLVQIDHLARRGGFTYVIEAVPPSIPVDKAQITSMVRRAWMVLRFVAGGAISIGPRVGLGSDGNPTWAWWGAGRTEMSGLRWCPNKLVNAAVPQIADGVSALSADPGLAESVDRAIGLLLATNEGVLDTKIPIACIGLELLAWSVLQHKEGLSKSNLNGRSSGGNVRKLLDWAGVDITLPADYSALAARLATVKSVEPTAADWEAPEIVFHVRNALVHPPKDVTDPEWPASGELIEAWQLSTWYLEVVLLRILGYEGEYTSRLDLRGRWHDYSEPLPWNVKPEEAEPES